MEKGLEHIFNQQTELIILGTFPSIQSREICYYNNPQNLFWSIIALLYNRKKPLSGRTERYNCLLSHKIGLWDVIQTCEFEQKSSLDSKIKKDSIVYNDFALIRQECPHLKGIVFNSRNAKKLFDRYLKSHASYELKIWLDKMTNNGKNVLPSTSSANARISKDEKIEKWRQLLTSYVKQE